MGQWASDISAISPQETRAKKNGRTNSSCYTIAQRVVLEDTRGMPRAFEKNMCEKYFRSPIIDVSVKGKTVCIAINVILFFIILQLAWFEKIQVYLYMVYYM